MPYVSTITMENFNERNQKMNAEENPVRFIHFEASIPKYTYKDSDGHKRIVQYHHAHITAAYQEHHHGPGESSVNVGFSFCSPSEQFNSHKGREDSTARLMLNPIIISSGPNSTPRELVEWALISLNAENCPYNLPHWLHQFRRSYLRIEATTFIDNLYDLLRKAAENLNPRSWMLNLTTPTRNMFPQVQNLHNPLISAVFTAANLNFTEGDMSVKAIEDLRELTLPYDVRERREIKALNQRRKAKEARRLERIAEKEARTHYLHND